MTKELVLDCDVIDIAANKLQILTHRSHSQPGSSDSLNNQHVSCRAMTKNSPQTAKKTQPNHPQVQVDIRDSLREFLSSWVYNNSDLDPWSRWNSLLGLRQHWQSNHCLWKRMGQGLISPHQRVLLFFDLSWMLHGNVYFFSQDGQIQTFLLPFSQS